MKNKYYVSFVVIYSEFVEAESFEEAAEKVENNCPYDIDSPTYVVNEDTGEEREM